MAHKLSRLFAALVLLSGAVLMTGQTPESNAPVPEPPPKPQFFSGTVTSVDREHVTVSRTLVGKTPETRRFLIKPDTKVGKSLKPKARVTVRYQRRPEGDVALEIHIRSQRTTRPS